MAGWICPPDEERKLLPEAGIDAGVLGGGGTLWAPALDDRSHPVFVQPDEPGSLVMSEWMPHRWEIQRGSGNSDFQGFFFELYNNSDTTIYLDGKLVGEAMTSAYSDSRCSAYHDFRNNPSGIWVSDLQVFPGEGRDYPLGPGQSVTIASEAINHSEFGPNLLDLRDADFEPKAGIAEWPADILRARYPGLVIVGNHYGYLDDTESASVVDRVNASGAGIVLVGMGTPVQELWVAGHRERIAFPVAWTVAAVFDFVVGAQPRAPRWLRDFHMEWLWRPGRRNPWLRSSLLGGVGQHGVRGDTGRPAL